MSQDNKTQLKSFQGKVTTVITVGKDGITPLMKTRADGSQAPYALCGVKFTEGPLAGKTAWAQRTLVNREGIAKDAVVKGDDISIVLVAIIDGKPFFEVATSANASDADLLAAFGEETVSTARVAEQAIPLAEAPTA